MLKALKSYWAFTNRIYKLGMLVLVPFGLVLGNIYIYRGYDTGSGIESFLILYVIDVVSDFFFMRGFYRKGNDTLAYMQGSPRFLETVREITIVDVIRRVMVYQIPYMVLLSGSIGEAGAVDWCRTLAALPWLETIMAQLVVLVSRHFVAWNHLYLCMTVGFVLIVISLILILFIGEQAVVNWTVGINAVLMIVVLIAAIVTVRYTDKKMEESYYD